MKFEDRSHAETEMKDNSDVPEARHGTLPKTKTSSKRTTKLHSTRPRKNGYSRPHPTQEPEERQIVVDSGADMHTVSKRDLDSAELETVRTSGSPTTVVTDKGEVRNRRRSHGICQIIGLIRDSYAS